MIRKAYASDLLVLVALTLFCCSVAVLAVSLGG